MPWLVKAEPDSRVVKGIDVAFGIDIFENVKTSHWDGVRNHQAKNFMKNDMKMNDPVLFYHSNTKVPGIAAVAHVSKEGYPDHTAWDEKHPYYDPKSDENNPTWFMVDVTLEKRLEHFVPLKLLQTLITLPSVPDELSSYLEESHLDALKDMVLLKRGRLSVQPVDQVAYDAIKLLGEKGGWSESMASKSKKGTGEGKSKSKAKSAPTALPKQNGSKKRSKSEGDKENGNDNEKEEEKQDSSNIQNSKKARRSTAKPSK